MKLIDVLLEIISPRKPDDVKSSRGTVPGLQGSTQPINKREFVTSKGNNVTVRFKPSMEDGMKSIDFSFYVNGTMDDAASTQGKDVDNDFEILSGVLHVGMQYVDRAKVNRVTFTAHTGNKDSKLVHNLPTDKYVANVKFLAQKFKEELINFKPDPAEVEKYQSYLQNFAKKFNLTPEVIAQKKYIYREELVQLVDEILNNKFENVDENMLNKYTSTLGRYSKIVEKWDSFKQFQTAVQELTKVAESHREGGAFMHHNRREGIYKRMINKYLSKDWNIEQHGTMFTLTRKNPIG